MFTNPTVLGLLIAAREQDIARGVSRPIARLSATAAPQPIRRPGVVHRLHHIVNRHYTDDCAADAATNSERRAA